VSTGTVKSQTHAALERLRGLVPDLVDGSADEEPPSRPARSTFTGGAS
jgi:hypothetical protein